DLSGKVALVTGGASGIGKAIAAGLIEHGAKVLVGSRTREKVDAAAAELLRHVQSAEEEPLVAGVAVDVTVDNSVEHAVRKAVDLFGRRDILVNSAGGMLRK